MSDPYSASSKRGKSKSNLLNDKVKLNSQNGTPVTFIRTVVKHNEIEAKTSRYKYNPRGWRQLTRESLSDILPSIEETGSNEFPGFALKMDDGTYNVFIGLRRRQACIYSKDADLVLYVADHSKATELDVSNWVNRSDAYLQPDILGRIDNLRYLLEEDPSDLNLDALKVSYGWSDGYFHEMKQFAELPSEFYELFPANAKISYNFLRTILPYSESLKSKDVIENVKTTLEGSDNLTDEDKWKQLRSKIVTLLKNYNTEKKPYNMSPELKRWHDTESWHDGFNVKTSNRMVTVKFNPKNLTEEKAEQLRRLLAE